MDTVPQWLETEKILSINRNSKYLIEIGENNQDNVKQLEEKYKEERALFGEKYPAEMMHLMQIANYFTNRIIKSIHIINFNRSINRCYNLYNFYTKSKR